MIRDVRKSLQLRTVSIRLQILSYDAADAQEELDKIRGIIADRTSTYDIPPKILPSFWWASLPGSQDRGRTSVQCAKVTNVCDPRRERNPR